MNITPSKYSLLIFLSLLITIVISSGPTQKTSCSTDQSVVVIDGVTPTSGKVFCIPQYLVIYGCEIYNSDLTCFKCPDQSSAIYLDIEEFNSNPNFRMGCVPYSQQVINCLRYKYKPYCQDKFQCEFCPTVLNMEYKLVNIVDHPNKIRKACAQTLIPGCLEYAAFQDQGVQIVIGCKTCKNMANMYSGNFYIFQYQTASKSCLLASEVSGCTDVNIEDSDYLCYSAACSIPFNFASGSMRVGCLTDPFKSALKDSCIVYDKYSATPADIKCTKCHQSYLLVDNIQTGASTFETLCLRRMQFQKGCKQYIYDPDQDNFLCIECISAQYDFVPIDDSYFPMAWMAGKKAGNCMPKGRFNQDNYCKTYAWASFTQDSMYYCDTCKDNTLTSPCFPPSAPCSGGQLHMKILNDGTLTDKCTRSNYGIDYCIIYGPKLSTKQYPCRKCATGYEIFTTRNIQNQLNDICALPSKKIPNCKVYDHYSLKICLQYESEKVCQVDSYPTVCAKQVPVGTSLVCVACPLGFTLKNNNCVKSVTYCSNLTMAGVCLACVMPEKYYLINNKCIERPRNCKIPSEDGFCSICETNYDLSPEKVCLISTRNTCPDGSYPGPNKICIPGLIKHCQTYNINGTCEKCEPKFILTNDKLKCENQDPFADLKPCPEKTDRTIVRRDFQGNCLIIDSECEYFNEASQKCIVCKNGAYAHTDGRCYKVVYVEDKN